MILRDRILAGLLDIYIPQGLGFESASSITSNTQQCFVNQFADDALEALAIKNEVKFLTKSIVPLLRVE
jgi:hypothetical protein